MLGLIGLLGAAQPTLNVRSIDVGVPTPPRGRTESTIATIEAEPGGVIAFIQRAVGFGRTVTISLTTSRVLRMVRGRNEEHSTSVPLANLASIHHAYAKSSTKLIMGMFLAMSGLAGVFAVGPKSVFGLLVGGAIIGWHFLSGPKFSVMFASANGVSLFLKVRAGTQTEDLVSFAEATSEQLRVNSQQVVATPPTLPASQPGFARA